MSASSGQSIAACCLVATLCGSCDRDTGRAATERDSRLHDPGADATPRGSIAATANSGAGAPGSRYAPGPTTTCQVAGAAGTPKPACDRVPEHQTFAGPLVNTLGTGSAGLTVGASSGGMLYVGIETTACPHAGCVSSAAVFRTDGGSKWETVLADTADVRLAVSDARVAWAPKHLISSDESVRALRADSLLESGVGGLTGSAYVRGLAFAPDALFLEIAAAGVATTRLERRPIDGAGRLGPAQLVEVTQGDAYGLRSNGEVLAWWGGPTVAVTSLDGHRLHVASLPEGADYRGLELSGSYAFVAYETKDSTGGELCALDLRSGNAVVRLGARPLVQICNLAANSTHLFWTQSAAPDTNCTEVWSQRLDGGAPRVLACGTDPLGNLLVADDEAVYWVDGVFHRLDPRGL